MNDKKYKFSDITGKIIVCAMEVHNVLGNGFQENIYQKALAFELNTTNLHFAQEFIMPIMYKGIQLGTRRVDFLSKTKLV